MAERPWVPVTLALPAEGVAVRCLRHGLSSAPTAIGALRTYRGGTWWTYHDVPIRDEFYPTTHWRYTDADEERALDTGNPGPATSR